MNPGERFGFLSCTLLCANPQSTVVLGGLEIENIFFDIIDLTHVLASTDVLKLPKCGLQGLKTFKNGDKKPLVRPIVISTK